MREREREREMREKKLEKGSEGERESTAGVGE